METAATAATASAVAAASIPPRNAAHSCLSASSWPRPSRPCPRRRSRGCARLSLRLPRLEAEYLPTSPPTSPHISGPRSGSRIHVSQPALERTRIQLLTHFRPYSLSPPPSSSRGALSTLQNTVFTPPCRRIHAAGERVARGPGRARGGQHVAPARARVVDRRRRRRRRRVRVRGGCRLSRSLPGTFEDFSALGTRAGG